MMKRNVNRRASVASAEPFVDFHLSFHLDARFISLVSFLDLFLFESFEYVYNGLVTSCVWKEKKILITTTTTLNTKDKCYINVTLLEFQHL